MQRLWGPLFERLGGNLPEYAVGYTKVMSAMLPDVDSSIKNENAIKLGAYFKVYPSIFEAMLSFIPDKSTSAAIREIIEQCKPAQAALSDGHFDLNAMNYLFSKWTRSLNGCLNNWPTSTLPQPPKNAKLLKGLSVL